MGTHPIFESDFDCLTDKNVVSTPEWHTSDECDWHADGGWFQPGPGRSTGHDEPGPADDGASDNDAVDDRRQSVHQSRCRPSITGCCRSTSSQYPKRDSRRSRSTGHESPRTPSWPTRHRVRWQYLGKGNRYISASDSDEVWHGE